MGYIGQAPANKVVTSADIEDGVVSAADLGANSVDSSELVDGSVDLAHLSASGTASSSTFLRGDNSWVAAGGDLSFGGDTFGADKTIGSNDTYSLSFETDGTERLKLHSDGRGLSEFTAKAWVNWDQNGALNDSHNVASITDHATGTYSVVLDNDMSGTDYCLTACAQRLAPGLDSTVSVDVNASLRTNGCDIYVVRIKADGNANVKVDVGQNWALFFGAN